MEDYVESVPRSEQIQKTNLTIGSTKSRKKQWARRVGNIELLDIGNTNEMFSRGLLFRLFLEKPVVTPKLKRPDDQMPGSKEQITDSQKKHHLSKLFIAWRSECAVALLAVNYISYLA